MFFHSIAILHSSAYHNENSGALRQDWPRIPLPNSRELLLASAALGRRVAALLDTEQAVPGVTTAPVRAELRGIGVLTTGDGGPVGADGLAVTAGWGRGGQNGVTMPGRGKTTERDYTGWLGVRALTDSAMRSHKTKPQELKAFLLSDQFKLEGFKDGPSRRRYIIGAALMGFGGMLAGLHALNDLAANLLKA